MNKISIKVRRELIEKDECLREARKLISEGRIRNMNELQLAREIRFHALAYYFCERTGRLKFVKAHADPIDMVDGGDRLIMRAAYAVSWKIPERKKRNK